MKYKKNLKSKNIGKIVLIILLLSISIYILYFSNNSTINNFNIEPFNNYLNICKSKITQFYNIPTSLSSDLNKSTPIQNNTPALPSCENYCREKNCDFFTISGDINGTHDCMLYNDMSNENLNIQVDCVGNKDKKIPYVGLTYNGQGFVSEDFFYKNQNKFTFKDFLLDEVNSLKSQYNNVYNSIANRNYDNIQNNYTSINQKLAGLASYLNVDYGTPESTTLYSELKPGKKYYNTMNFQGNDISFVPLLKKFHNLEKDTKNVEGVIEDSMLEFNRRNLVYTILSLIMIITFIILVLYKFIPGLIPDSVIFFYFIGIAALVYAIHLFIKT